MQALRDADAAAHECMRSGYLHMAAAWLGLAQEAERLVLTPEDDEREFLEARPGQMDRRAGAQRRCGRPFPDR